MTFEKNFYNCCEEAVINFLYLDFNKIKGFDPNSNKVKIATSNNSRIFATEAFIKMNDCILKYREKMGALDEKCNINTGNALQDGTKKALEVPALYKAYVSAAEKLSQAYQNMIDAFEKLTNKEDVYPGRFESLNNRNLRIRKLTKGLRDFTIVIRKILMDTIRIPLIKKFWITRLRECRHCKFK